MEKYSVYPLWEEKVFILLLWKAGGGGEKKEKQNCWNSWKSAEKDIHQQWIYTEKY